MAKKHKILCFRCGHSGETHLAHPKRCPRCNSPYYDKPKIRGGGWSYISPHLQVRIEKVFREVRFPRIPSICDSAVLTKDLLKKRSKLSHFRLVPDKDGEHWYLLDGCLKPLFLSDKALISNIIALIEAGTGYTLEIGFPRGENEYNT